MPIDPPTTTPQDHPQNTDGAWSQVSKIVTRKVPLHLRNAYFGRRHMRQLRRKF